MSPEATRVAAAVAPVGGVHGSRMILLFGGAGQLGRELIALASERSIAIEAVARAEADISDLAAVSRTVAAIDPDIVVHAR